MQLAFATFPATGRIALGHYSPYAMSFWRVTGAALFFVLFLLVREGRIPLPERRDRLKVLWLSLFGISLNQMLFLVGLSLSTAVRGGLFVMLIPILTTAWAVLRRAETLSARKAAGVLLAAVGILLLTGVDLVRGLGTGDLFFLLNGACYSVYLVEARPLLRRYPPLHMVTWVFLAALPVMFVIPLAGVRLLPEDAAFSGHSAMLWIILGPTIWSYLGNIIALRHLPASATAIAISAQPLIAAVLAMVLLGEEIHWRECVTFMLVVSGIWLALMPKRHDRAATGTADAEASAARR